METAEKILKENGVIDKNKSINEMFALNITRDGYVHTTKMIIKSMQEYGKLMYNQGIQDAADNAEADVVCLTENAEIQYHKLLMNNEIEIPVIKNSILKLKK